MEYYNHTEQPDWRLNDRHTFLIDHVKRPHTPERMTALRREMACIGFELLMRDIDRREHQNRVAEADTLSYDVNELLRMLGVDDSDEMS